MAKKQKKVVKANVVVPKILIAIPILAWTHEFATSFLSFWTDVMTYNKKGRKFHVGYKFAYRRPVHMAQEELALFAVDSGCTHILLMDDDIYDVTVEDLLKLLDADKDVVGGIMHTSGFPHAMCAFRRYNRKTKVVDQPIMKGPARLYEIPPEQRKGLQKVDLIPFGFTLIKTQVFKDMKRPWFNCDTQAPTDSWFADRLLKKKLEYYADFDVWLNHRGITRENQQVHVQLGMIEAQKANKSQIVNLTHDEMRRHEAMMTMKLEDAEKQAKESTIGKQTFYDKAGDGKVGKLIQKKAKDKK